MKIQQTRVWIPRSGGVLEAGDELRYDTSLLQYEDETYKEAYLNVFERKLIKLVASQITEEEVDEEADKLRRNKEKNEKDKPAHPNF